MEPPWELGVLELDELPLLVLFRGVSTEKSVLRSGLLRQHKHSVGTVKEDDDDNNTSTVYVCVCVYLARMR